MTATITQLKDSINNIADRSTLLRVRTHLKYCLNVTFGGYFYDGMNRTKTDKVIYAGLRRINKRLREEFGGDDGREEGRLFTIEYRTSEMDRKRAKALLERPIIKGAKPHHLMNMHPSKPGKRK